MTGKKSANKQPVGWGGKRAGSGSKPGVPRGQYKNPEDKAVTVGLSMPGELHRRLKARADIDGMTVNDAIREAIGRYLG